VDAFGRDKRSNGLDDDGNGFVDDWCGWNFVENNNNPRDGHGHGTHCAGTIGAVGNDGAEIADWRLNMLWCEKTHFVRETIEKQYFDTEYYGWCDVGYFRDTLSSGGPGAAATHPAYRERIREHWPNPDKINRLHKDKVYYGCNISPSNLHKCYTYYAQHFQNTARRDVYSPRAHLLSGGFYITGREKALWWCCRFQEILELYIANNVVIQDDQHIIAHCVFTNGMNGMNAGTTNPDFCIIKVNELIEDKRWFLFRDVLL
jgi:hypothetical protein